MIVSGKTTLRRLQAHTQQSRFPIGMPEGDIRAFGMPFAYFAVSAATGTSISSLRITRLVAFKVANSKPCP
jgi:hypothetical protein